MIRIGRGACPSVLENANSSSEAYRNRKVVEALWTMQHGKCCYSEMKIPENGHGKAVEHFRPKSVFKGLRNDWANLLLVCPYCNGMKSAKFPVMLTDNPDETKVVYINAPTNQPAAIVDPTGSVDPELELTYFLEEITHPLFGQILPRDDSILGEQTIEVTGIGEPFFVTRRRQRLLKLLLRCLADLLEAKDNNDEEQQQRCLNELSGFMQPTAEFAGLAREFARYHKLDKRFGLAIPGQ